MVVDNAQSNGSLQSSKLSLLDSCSLAGKRDGVVFFLGRIERILLDTGSVELFDKGKPFVKMAIN